MSSRGGGKKSQYFRILQAKKRKANSSENPPNVKPSKASNQKSISCFFAPKLLVNNPKPVKECTRSNDATLKRKLDSFKFSDLETQGNPEKQLKLISDDEPLVSSGSSKKKSSLTPLEQQVQQLKAKYPDTLLMVECGYRYRFFGCDAEKAALVLDISAHEDTVGSGLLGLTASVPTFNGYASYVRKLILQGHKVGIVAQTETSAEKKVQKSSTKGPFARDVTEIFTSATFLDELYDDKLRSHSILAISGSATLALTPHLGKLVLTKSISPKELRDHLNKVEPSEIVTGKDEVASIEQYIHDQTFFNDNPVRLEKLDLQDVLNELEEIMLNEDHTVKELRQAWPSLFKDEMNVFKLMYQYLKQFSLTSLLTKSLFEIGSSTSQMNSSGVVRLPQMTIENLELASTAKGSLMSIMNCAKTKAGKRMFKSWMLNPITIQADLEQRLDAVEFLKNDIELKAKLKNFLSKNQYDYEIFLSSAINQKMAQDKFKRVMTSLASISLGLASIVSDTKEMPSLLQKIVGKIIEAFSTTPQEILKPLDNVDEIISNEVIEDLQEQITEIKDRLDNHSGEIAKVLGLLSFQYCSVAGSEFLIEVKNSTNVPQSWRKVNATQKLSRYHSPLVLECLPQLQFLKEKLASEAQKSWKAYLSLVIPKLRSLLSAIKFFASLDVLVALANTAQKQGFCRPTFVPDDKYLVDQGRNIVVEESLASRPGLQFVANDINLEPGQALILTGPNMGGKSCYLRQVGQIAILAQMGSFVPAAKASVPLFDAIYVRMGARDDLERGKSTLFVEMEEASLILNQATKHSLVLLDELGRGTSTYDGTAIAKSVIYHLTTQISCTTLFVTHFKILTQIYPAKCGHMGYINEDSEEDVLFLYQLCQGSSENSFGINVAKMAGIGLDIIEHAKEIAELYQLIHQGSEEK